MPRSSADSAITFPRKPASSFPMVRTAVSSGGSERLTTVCRAVITCAATTTASTDWCGEAACPPRPVIVMRRLVGEAKNGPGATLISPTGTSALMCRPRQRSTSGFFRMPSWMQRAAPPEASSAGWKTKRTLPASDSRAC